MYGFRVKVTRRERPATFLIAITDVAEILDSRGNPTVEVDVILERLERPCGRAFWRVDRRP